MSIRPTKADEVIALERFRLRFPEFPRGEIMPLENPNDPPDFLVRGTTATVGIEVTRVFRDERPNGSALQARYSNLNAIVTDAEKLCWNWGVPPVIVSAYFNPHHTFRQRDVLPCGHALAEAVAHSVPPVGQSVHIDTVGDVRLLEISITRPSWHLEHMWRAPEAAWQHERGADLLKLKFRNKNDRYEAAREKCDAVWLLIVTNTSGLASIVEFTSEALTGDYTSPFDRAFLLHNWGQVTELKLQRCGDN